VVESAFRLAGVAQLVEQLIRNQQVTRSSRVAGSKSFDTLPFLPFLGLKLVTSWILMS
jgi:hypothetical protein